MSHAEENRLAHRALHVSVACALADWRGGEGGSELAIQLGCATPSSKCHRFPKRRCFNRGDETAYAVS